MKKNKKDQISLKSLVELIKFTLVGIKTLAIVVVNELIDFIYKAEAFVATLFFAVKVFMQKHLFRQPSGWLKTSSGLCKKAHKSSARLLGWLYKKSVMAYKKVKIGASLRRLNLSLKLDKLHKLRSSCSSWVSTFILKRKNRLLIIGVSALYGLSLVLAKQNQVDHMRGYNLASYSGVDTRMASKVKASLKVNHLYKKGRHLFITAEQAFSFESAAECMDVLEEFSYAGAAITQKELLDVKSRDNWVYLKYGVTIKVPADHDLASFPFKKRNLNLVLENKHVFPEELLFVAGNNNLKVSDEAGIKLDAQRLSAAPGVIKGSGFSYPVIVYGLNLGYNFQVFLLLPLLLCLFAGFMIAAMQLKLSLQVFTLTGLSGVLLASRMLLHPVLPASGGLTSFDAIFYLSITVLLILLTGLYYLKSHKKGLAATKLNLYRSRVFALAMLVFWPVLILAIF